MPQGRHKGRNREQPDQITVINPQQDEPVYRAIHEKTPTSNPPVCFQHPRLKIEMPKSSRTGRKWNERKRRNDFVFLVILPIGQTQRVTGDAIVVISKPGCTDSADEHDW